MLEGNSKVWEQGPADLDGGWAVPKYDWTGVVDQVCPYLLRTHGHAVPCDTCLQSTLRPCTGARVSGLPDGSSLASRFSQAERCEQRQEGFQVANSL